MNMKFKVTKEELAKAESWHDYHISSDTITLEGEPVEEECGYVGCSIHKPH